MHELGIYHCIHGIGTFVGLSVACIMQRKKLFVYITEIVIWYLILWSRKFLILKLLDLSLVHWKFELKHMCSVDIVIFISVVCFKYQKKKSYDL